MTSSKKREEIDNKYKWNVNNIYKSSNEWEEDFSRLQKSIDGFNTFYGKLSSSDTLLDYLVFSENIIRLYTKLYGYARLNFDTDTRSSKDKAMVNKIDSLGRTIQVYDSTCISEIKELGSKYIMSLIENNDKFIIYKKLFEEFFDGKEHLLNKDVEDALSKVDSYMDNSYSIYEALYFSDIKYPSVYNENGEEVNITASNFNSLLSNADREFRKNVFNSFFNKISELKNAFGTNLINHITNVSKKAKLRNYNSSIEAYVCSERKPLSIYTSTIDTVNENLHLLHRYMNLKKRLLGYDKIHMYDLSAPVFTNKEENYHIDKAIAMIKNGVSPLGEDYVNTLSKGIKDGWCDMFYSEGKRTAPYSWSSYDTMPYVLMNYEGSLRDVLVLAHELGHAMHYYYSNTSQPYRLSNYSMFNAEVASLTNEILLMDNLIKTTTDKEERRNLIVAELEQMRLTIFRQTMFAEFEMIVHEKIDNGEFLTTEDLIDVYYNLNAKYFGPDVILDKGIEMEWAKVPHFYTDFYVYQYVTGYVAANCFATGILSKEKGTLENYNKFLRAGGSDYSIEIQKVCGVDLTTSKPMNDVMNRFSNLLNLLEKEIDLDKH